MNQTLRFALEYVAFIAVFAPLVAVIYFSMVGLLEDTDDLD